MRILHVVSSLNMGGAEQFVVNLTFAMKSCSAAEVAVFSFGNENEPLSLKCSQLDVRVLFAKSSRLSQFYQIKRLLKDFDVVHIHSSYALMRWLLAVIVTPSRRAQLFYTRHNNQIHGTLKWQAIYSVAAQLLSGIVFISKLNQQEFLAAYPRFSNKQRLIPNGIPGIAVSRVEKPSLELHLGSVGRFVPLKAQHLLLDALALLSVEQRRRIVVHFYGEGPLQEAVERHAQNQIGAQVFFHGVVQDKVTIYQSIDLLIVTSETEGLSLVILEAMAAGIPVVASRVGGNPELVVDGVTGSLYNYADITHLAAIIAEALDDQQRLKKYGEAGKALFHQQFTMQICVDSHLGYYQSRV